MNDQPTRSRSSSVNRRDFFRRLFLSGLEAVEQAGEALGSAGLLGEAVPTAGESVGADAAVRYLRPPGALPEGRFAVTCTRQGRCVSACPANCIRLVPDVAEGLPHIVARQSPCVVCDDLSCTKVCPSGALEPVERVADIHMGLAVVAPGRCLRSDCYASDEGCRLCVNQCPLGEAALGVDSSGRIEVRAGCIGCGVCEHVCPTEPASIAVMVISDPSPAE